MIFNFKNLKLNAGMTYVELIVVLSIFATLSAVVIYNYGEFQAKVDMKNLASEIALKVIEAQKSAINGVLPPSPYNPLTTWKPAYGVNFDIAAPNRFIYFVDLDNGWDYDQNEELDTVTITKNDFISKIEKCSSSSCGGITNPLSITFKRPDSSAHFTGATINGSNYVKITIQSSPKSASASATIKIYPSGRVQVN